MNHHTCPGPARRAVAALSVLAVSASLAVAAAPVADAAPTAAARADLAPTPGGLDLATASIADLQAALTAGRTTSVALVEAYLDRIDRLDAHGPSLNAIRHLSASALADARAADAARAAGTATGPLAGVPILVKDNIDHAGDPTTAGSVALANSFPSSNATLVDSLESAGAIILGKTNLTEFANFMTNGMPAGYSSLGGQVLNPYDLSQTPSGSSAGSGVAAAASLAAGAVGTETSGSIISPANANSLVGIKPTVGLISRTGVVPISATQDTAGPMTRSVADAAAILTGMTTGADPEDAATQDGQADAFDDTDYTEALSTDALQGVRLGFVTSTNETYLAALQVLRDQGATLVQVIAPANAAAGSILTQEFERDLNSYLSRLPASAPMKSLSDIIAFNSANAGPALKFGQTLLTDSEAVDLSDPAQAASYESNRDLGLQQSRTNIDTVLTTNDVDAIVSSAATTGVGARAGYPSITLPAGYAAANRRPVPITFLGTAYTEESLIGLAYDYEQAAQVRRTPQEINPSAFVCTGISPETAPDASCADEEPATPVASATLASLTKTTSTQGRKPARIRVAVAAAAVTPTGQVVATTRGGVRFTGTLRDGRAVLEVPRRLKPGRYIIAVSYAGSPEVGPSSDSVTLRVQARRR